MKTTTITKLISIMITAIMIIAAGSSIVEAFDSRDLFRANVSDNLDNTLADYTWSYHYRTNRNSENSRYAGYMTLSNCHRRCASTSSCKAFSWNSRAYRYYGSTSGNGYCYLRYDYGKPSYGMSYISAIKLPDDVVMSDIVDAKYEFPRDSILYDEDNMPVSEAFNANTMDICEDQCIVDEECKAWTYNERYHVCSIHKNVPVHTTDERTVNGGNVNMPHEMYLVPNNNYVSANKHHNISTGTIEKIDKHNCYRSLHGNSHINIPDVVWDPKIAEHAFLWYQLSSEERYEECHDGHSCGEYRASRTSENIGTLYGFYWPELSHYTPYRNQGDFEGARNNGAGHLMNVIDVCVRKIGCYKSVCQYEIGYCRDSGRQMRNAVRWQQYVATSAEAEACR
jgi:hypothetical protein